MRPAGDVDLRLTPGSFTDFIAKHKGRIAYSTTAGMQPDLVLLHEMVHAARIMRGICNPAPIGFGYHNEEEYFAILVTNICASETNRVIWITDTRSFPDFRCDHTTNKACSLTDEEFLPASRTDSSGATQAALNFRLVGKFINQHPATASTLRYINCPFNPIRRYFELMAKGVAVS